MPYQLAIGSSPWLLVPDSKRYRETAKGWYVMKSIAYKMLISFCSVAAVSIVFIGIVVTWKLGEGMTRQSENLSTVMTTRMYDTLNLPHQAFTLLVRDDIRRSVQSLRDHPTIRANLESWRLAALKIGLQETALAQGLDFALLFDLEGRLMTSFPADLYDLKVEEYFASWEFGAYALNMGQHDDPETLGIWETFTRYDSEILELFGVNDRDSSGKGTLSIVAAGIVRDDFADPLGLCIVGKMLDTYDEPLQQLYEITGYANALFVDTVPIAQAGFEQPGQGTFELSMLQIPPELPAEVYATEARTNQMLTLASETYLTACSAIQSFTAENIGVFCVGTPESQIAVVQDIIHSCSLDTGKNIQMWVLGIGGLSLSFFVLVSLAMTTRLVKPIKQLSNLANIMAVGDFQQDIPVTSHDEIGMLADAFRHMKDTIGQVLREIEGLIQAIQEGKLDVRGNADIFSGGWKELVRGMNNVIEAFVTPIQVTATYLDRIAKGDVPKKISDKYQGDFNAIKHNLNVLIDNLGNVLDEVAELILAVQEGKLAVRGNVEVFSGDWRELVAGINNVVQAFVEPLNLTATYIDVISQGDIPEKITAEYKGDFNHIKDNLNSLIDGMHAVTGLAEEMAVGNLVVTVKERSAQDRLMQALNAMVRQLRTVVLNVQSATDNVTAGSEAMNLSAEEMSHGASAQAAAAEQAASSMQQMTANIRQNADNALQTKKLAVKAAEDARTGGVAVAETVVAMKNIVKKVAIIEEIARQTHMLSLNATIEAAKAQDYGKGFGVVAQEVRALAERSQAAAVEINHVASASIGAAETAGKMLEKLVPDIQKTATLIQEISAASEDQNSGAEHVNQAIQLLDHITQQNAATSEELAATAEEFAQQAQQLRYTMEFFRLDNVAWKAGDAGRKAPEQILQAVQDPKTKTQAIHLEHREEIEKDQKSQNDTKSDGQSEQKGMQRDAPDATFEKY